jgi:hypothetical protein
MGEAQPMRVATLPTCQLIVFPLEHRVGKIRDVAGKMLATKSERQADHYRSQVSEAFIHKLRGIGMPDAQIADELASFWSCVNAEMIRRSHGWHTGGAA